MKLALVPGFAMLAVPAYASASPLSQLVVFGDSLSDTSDSHKGAKILGLLDSKPSNVGYYKGRCSNGPE